MGFTVEVVHPLLAARIHGLDLSHPVSLEDVEAIEQTSGRYPVLIFPKQQITDDQLLAFSANFGPVHTAMSYQTRKDEHRLQPKITDISNVGKDNQTFRRGDHRRMNTFVSKRWHTDASYEPIPARYSFLLAYTVAKQGGETQFADMRAAYDEMPEDLRPVVENLSCEYNILWARMLSGYTEFPDDERAKLAPSQHRLVRRHPVSGRKSLYLSGHATHIVDWPIPEGRDLLRELMEYATHPQFVYTHRWSVRDLVMWDNRVLMHRGRRHIPESDPREMHRATVMDDPAWTRERRAESVRA
ncbi:TauD/TfdA dioxygenase family protein [Paraburkholderia sp.]|uniref:TauD/TfdA dioxygenase family protein n=1 Tax=Paraburkholderia sp. TaxID=1926495 RepID=UPI0039E3D75B